jgi:glycerol uptake facilitator-like aquaporin
MSGVKPSGEVAPLARKLIAEGLGTAMLVTVVVGSGIAAQTMSPDQTGLQLLENSIATMLGLAVLILALGPVSGAHFNPVVSAMDWWVGRHDRGGLTSSLLCLYVAVQFAGGVAGAVLANLMYGLDALQVSHHARDGGGLLLGEIVATAGLVALVLSLARTGRAALSAAAVGAYIGAAYWFTSSTSFANPAVTVGRMFTDTFAGIAPSSVPAFVVAQVLGGGFGLVLALALYPDVRDAADNVTTPHPASPAV